MREEMIIRYDAYDNLPRRRVDHGNQPGDRVRRWEMRRDGFNRQPTDIIRQLAKIDKHPERLGGPSVIVQQCST